MVQDRTLAVAPDEIATSYVYTRNFIETEVIPTLETLRDQEPLVVDDDTASATFGTLVLSNTALNYNNQISVWQSNA